MSGYDYVYTDKSSPTAISRRALLSDEVFTLISKGSCGTHTLVTATEGAAKPAFLITYNAHVLDSLDVLSFGMTGMGSSPSNMHAMKIINTGTADITSAFTISLTDDAPGNVFVLYSGFGFPLERGEDSAFFMYRDTAYPGVYSGTLSIYQSQVGGTPFYLSLESY